MKAIVFASSRNMLIIISLLFFVFFLYTPGTSAQNRADFSGEWEQDSVKSDDFYKSFNVRCIIKQTSQTITLTETFYDKSGKEITTRERVYNLDGKEVSKEENGGINKESAVWSADGKTLTTKSTRTAGSDIYGSSTTYALSENGLLLTLQTTDINPFGPSVKQVFNKKK